MGEIGEAMDQWQSVLLYSVISNGFLIWLVKWQLGRWEARNKRQFDDALDEQKAVFNAALSKQAFEHQTVYPRLYDKSLEVVTESYIRLSRFSTAVVQYTNLMRWTGSPSQDEQLTAVGETFNEFRDYFYGHRLYIPREAAEEIDKQTQVLVGTANVYQFMVHKGQERNVDWVMIEKKIREEMLPATKELEKTYRTLVRIEAVFPGFDPPADEEHATVLGRA